MTTSSGGAKSRAGRRCRAPRPAGASGTQPGDGRSAVAARVGGEATVVGGDLDGCRGGCDQRRGGRHGRRPPGASSAPARRRSGAGSGPGRGSDERCPPATAAGPAGRGRRRGPCAARPPPDCRRPAVGRWPRRPGRPPGTRCPRRPHLVVPQQLRGQPARGPHDRPGHREGRGLGEAGDPEVDEDRAVGAEDDVGRAHVPMHDPRGVDRDEGVGEAGGQPVQLRTRQRAVGRHPLGERRPDDQLGGQPGSGGFGVSTEDGLHPRVLHPLGGGDLPGEAGPSRGVAQHALGQDLHRHLGAVGTGGGPHLAHPAGAQRADQCVGPEGLPRCRHQSRPINALMPTECPAVNPPSTARACPVTNEASSEAKKAATAAISSGRPKRPSSCCSRMRSR